MKEPHPNTPADGLFGSGILPFAGEAGGPAAKIIKVLDVSYTYLALENGDDLYVTEFGLPFLDIIKPENWYYGWKTGLRNNWEKLNGSGTLYRVHNLKAGKGRIDIVVKWNRIGQDVPGRDPDSADDYTDFNSPFEEFSLLMELRSTRYESPGAILTHKPLAIYVPAERVNPELIGRKEYNFNSKAKMSDIELDLNRMYILIYEWVKGVDLVEASNILKLPDDYIRKLTFRAEKDLSLKGFKDHDRKPSHIIVRPVPGERLAAKKGRELYAYVDFEMLRRTPEREKMVKDSKRAEYLLRQRDRFDPGKPGTLPAHLKLVNIFGVDYIYGRVESTGGALWVVGRDTKLFDYFLPERWRRTPRTKISHSNEIYRTTTKDGIHLVWKISRAGEKPVFFDQNDKNRSIVDYGYNSPFEEFAFALELSKKGLPTIYPRAIYRTGYQAHTSEYISDDRKYEAHKGIVMPDGLLALQKGYNYLMVLGYWNGPDELLAVRDGEFYSGINLLHARNEKIISNEVFEGLMADAGKRLKSIGFEDLNLRGEHFIISLDHKGNLILDKHGKPEIRCCNFDFLKKTS